MKKKFTCIFLLLNLLSFGQTAIGQDTIVVTNEIQEITIPVPRKKKYIDKTSYTFNQEAIEKARYAKDLLLTLPELHLDPISNTIVSIKGATTLLLINGIEATDLQIRSIKPESVIRVEYYDIPPTRWENRANQVVNIMTRNPEQGYMFGIETTSALTTGFLNGSLYTNITKGKNNFALEYYIYFRDYKDRTSVNKYEYDLNKVHYTTKDERKEYFGYTDQSVTLRYTNLETDNYVFQSKLDLNLNTSYAYAHGINLVQQNDIVANHLLYNHSNTNYLKPTLDLYYAKKIKDKDEFIINVVGSTFTTKNNDSIREWIASNNVEKYNYSTLLEADQQGFVGEVTHGHQFELGKLTSGYRFSYQTVKNNLLNLNGFSTNTVNYSEHYLYTEFSGKTNSFMYRLGVGLTNSNNKNRDVNINTWTPTPKLVIGYELSKHHSLKLSSSYSPLRPSSSALSSNIIQLVEHITQTGNPHLVIQKSFTNNLIYSFHSKNLELTLNAFFTYTTNPYNQLYREDLKEGIVRGYKLTYENAIHAQKHGVQLTGSIQPFGTDILTFKINLTPTNQRFKTSDSRVLKHDYIENYFIVSSVYKNFSLDYQFNIRYYSLQGAQLYSQENTSDLFLSYKHNNWKFSTGIYWLGMPATYKQNTLDKQYVNYMRIGKIWDNSNMFILSISYDVRAGKKNKVNRTIENQTDKAVTF
ncbi:MULTISPECIES: outer membrane beta-barrel protein [unclassified Myroides]|uniref:outer membrane beta-barrel protein n=1 Tax=unclassified Myroides TaxID=2642485 RepID=UPI003D2F7B51